MSRLGPARLAGIAAWTAVATGWVAAVITRTAASSPEQEEGPFTSSVVESVDVASGPALPALPDGGLVIIRSVPDRAQSDTRIVVRQPPAPRPAPPRVVSSGS